jgi:meiotic recombination protein REC8, fungi type
MKPLVDDQRTELSNRELSQWNTSYLENMAEATRTKVRYKALVQARKNAAFWVLEQGIGGVQAAFGQDRVPHPLSVFSGQALLDALTGHESSPAGTKRSRSSISDDEGDQESRRIRARGEEEKEVGRGDDCEILVLDDDIPVS